jgi:cytochrome b6-f complex iron-sulfur subunit
MEVWCYARRVPVRSAGFSPYLRLARSQKRAKARTTNEEPSAGAGRLIWGPMNLNRREFVAASTVTVCGCIAGCQSDRAGDAAAPSGETDASNLPPETNLQGTVDVGTISDYPRDGVYDRFARSDRIYVVRQNGRVYALRAVCTHRACLVVPDASALRCPCHGSRFEADGTVTKGPATRQLAHYAIARTDGGRLIVDKSKRLTPDANDPAAYVLL